jgi:plastocyanin
VTFFARCANRNSPVAELTDVNVSTPSLRTIATIGVALALTLAGCGGDDSGATTTVGGAPPPTPQSTAPAQTEGAVITIAGFAFSGVTEVPVGTTVTVTNADSTTHTWTADDGTFDSGGIAPNGSFSFTFTEAGEFPYHCNIHRSMKGTIVVTG